MLFIDHSNFVCACVRACARVRARALTFYIYFTYKL